MDSEVKEVKVPLIYGKIAAISASIGAIAKAEENKQQGFKYRGIDTVVNAVSQHFKDNGVFFVSSILSEEHRRIDKGGKNYDHAIIGMRYTFYAIDGSSVATEVVGEGADYSGDKASNKAMSIALKYALLQILNVPTVMIDPDRPQEYGQPDQNPNATKERPRDERKLPPPSQDAVNDIVARWRETDLEVIGQLSKEEVSIEFRKFFKQATGRDLTGYKAEHWTQADIDACEKHLVKIMEEMP